MTLPEPAQPSTRALLIHLFRRVVRPVARERRAEVQVQLRDASHPDFDFFLLVVLSGVIATLGLLTDSSAVIIGAMLVAPLMSPIVGLGLASVTGDARLFRDATVGLVRGASLAVLISAFLTVANRILPFFPIQDVSSEILARTHPSPIDLTIALAGGLAAAFALAQPNLSAALPGVAISTALMPPLCTVGIGLAIGRWDVAGGALLLFVTNAVTIAFAGMLIFFVLGFSPQHHNDGWLPRGLVIAALLTLILLIPLTWVSVRFVREASMNREIERVVSEEVAALGAELADWSPVQAEDALQLTITVRTTRPFEHADVVQLQEGIAFRLQRPVSVVVNQVFAARLDPLVPPTFTHTPTPATLTPTASFTATATRTPTSTHTPVPSSTPGLARLDHTSGRTLDLVQRPGGPSIGVLRPGDMLTLLHGREVAEGLVWLEVTDADGRVGWVPQIYLAEVTRTPSPAGTAAP